MTKQKSKSEKQPEEIAKKKKKRNRNRTRNIIPTLQPPAQQINLQSHHDGGTGDNSQHHVGGDRRGTRVLVLSGGGGLATLGGGTTLARLSRLQAALTDEVATLDDSGSLELVETSAINLTGGLEVKSSANVLEGTELDTIMG